MNHPRAENVVDGSVDLARCIDEVVALTQPRWKNQALGQGIGISVDKRVADVPRQGGWDAPESLVSQVARRLCESVLGRLAGTVRPRHWALDTVANAS